MPVPEDNPLADRWIGRTVLVDRIFTKWIKYDKTPEPGKVICGQAGGCRLANGESPTKGQWGDSFVLFEQPTKIGLIQ